MTTRSASHDQLVACANRQSAGVLADSALGARRHQRVSHRFGEDEVNWDRPQVLTRIGLLVSKVDTGTRVASSRIEAGAGARHTAALVVQALGLPPDALVVDGDSSTVRVLLGPDAHLLSV